MQRLPEPPIVYLADGHPESADYDDNYVRRQFASLGATEDRTTFAHVVRAACRRWLRRLRCE